MVVEGGKKVSRELVHDIVMKMSALASEVRLYPRRLLGDADLVYSLGKCFEAGALIVRCYVEGERLEDLEECVRDFNVGYKLLMEALER